MRKDELIKKISDLKEGADDSTALLYNEIINELNNTKKYGLVWDTEHTKEDAVLKCEKEIPILSLDETKTIINGGQNNILIEGDNYYSLIALNMIAKESIDVIYIDPPYNTGNKTSDGGFRYNDNFIKDDNGFRHSSFLSFMNSRLRLAKQILKKDGSIFISIDDNECSALKMLCDDIFGVNHFVTIIPRITKPQRAGQERYMDISHDYILVYSMLDDFANVIDRDYDISKVKEDKIGKYIVGDTKAILAAQSQGYSEGGDYDFEYNGKIYKPIDKKGVRNRWLWTKERMEAAAKLGILVETKSTLRMQLYIDKKFEEGTNQMVEKDEKLIFHTSDFMTNNDYSNPKGVSDLNAVDNNLKPKFNNPKPVELIKKLISFCPNKSSIILDFFAGSGTTGQAVLELNKEDGGNRKCILCTNNENNICEEVTYQRLKTVITGKREDGSKYSDGLNCNLYFLRTDFINDENNTDQAKYNLVEKVDVLLCIKEDLFIKKIRDKCFSTYTNSDENKHMFIYNDYYNEKSFNDFKDIIKQTSGKKIVYVYSTDNNVDESLFEDLKDIELKTIPSKIYEIYKEIVEDSKRGL